MKRTNLDNTSWIEEYQLSEVIDKETFEKLWDLCPTQIWKYGLAKRYRQVYRYDYKTTNMHRDKVLPVPDILEPFIKIAQQYKDVNGIILNWYPDGEYYINMHCDDYRFIERDPDGGTTVIIITWIEHGYRIFRITDNKHNKKIDLKTNNGSVIIMKGKCQDDYLHGILPTDEDCGRRISMVFRKFIDYERK
jgi:alkylated DNA repair dioxygenase AlkB